MKTALITGISGQDGSYLAELLISRDYRVAGIIRRNSICENQTERLSSVIDDIELFYGDVTDAVSLNKIVKEVKPDEIYNLAGQSQVRISFEIPQFTIQTNGVGVMNMLDAFKNYAPEARFYQASSSEMFGNSIDTDGFQRETTPMHPVSPYGCAKLLGYSLVCHYRRAYGLFASNGILFNHESPRRSSNFVTAKIVKQAVRIKQGLADKLVLGNLDSQRDWGHSRDYVDAMRRVLSHGEPDDFVIATGQTRSVRDLCRVVFTKLNLDYMDYVVSDLKYRRPEELSMLKGDSTKARSILGWEPKCSFEEMIDEMITHWMESDGSKSLVESGTGQPASPVL